MIQRVGPGQPLVQLHPSRLTDNFRAARKRADLPSSLTFHSLRHSFASWLAALGTDFKTLRELIGHRSGEATQIYVHGFNPIRRSAIEKLHLPRTAANAQAAEERVAWRQNSPDIADWAVHLYAEPCYFVSNNFLVCMKSPAFSL